MKKQLFRFSIIPCISISYKTKIDQIILEYLRSRSNLSSWMQSKENLNSLWAQSYLGQWESPFNSQRWENVIFHGQFLKHDWRIISITVRHGKGIVRKLNINSYSSYVKIKLVVMIFDASWHVKSSIVLRQPACKFTLSISKN